eukprot:4453858-Alexandrium_andersonii.AAC.1
MLATSHGVAVLVAIEGVWSVSGRVIGAVWARLVELNLGTRQALQEWSRLATSGARPGIGTFTRTQLTHLLG